MPGGGAASALLRVGIIGALGLYGAANSLYNVEGGHRAIMFNRIVGVKDQVIVLPYHWKFFEMFLVDIIRFFLFLINSYQI